MGHIGAFHGWVEGRKAPLVAHILYWWNLTQLYLRYLKKIQKIYKSHATPLEFCWHRHFSPKISKFCYIKKDIAFCIAETYCILIHIFMFSNFLTFFESVKLIFRKMVSILMMSAKSATVSHPKIKVFWSKGYGVMISVHDFTKFLSPHLKYIIDVVMWPKFGNSSISIKKVMTSILEGFDQQKNQFFWGVLFVQVQ